MPQHPDTLAKYCSASRALDILQSQQLRWSAPALLADPFELNHQTALSFNPQMLLKGVIQAACSMIFAREQPRGNSPLTTAVRRWRDEDRFNSPEEAEEVLEELMARVVDQCQDDIDVMMSDWRRYTRALRICTFTARTDNLTAWQYFADHHRGAALKFACGEDTVFNAPLAVRYSPARPEISSLKEQLNSILYNQKPHPQAYFQDKFLSKPPMAKGEQEWRCFYSAEQEASFKEKDENLWFDERPFASNTLKAVYFGAFMPVQQKKQLLKVIEQQYPNTKVFKAAAIAGKYEIQFTRVNTG